MSDLSISQYFPFPRVVLVDGVLGDLATGAKTVLTFREDRRHNPLCSECGQGVSSVHSSFPRRIRDLSLAHSTVELIIPNRKVRCPRCGDRVEAHDFVAPGRRLTRRLETYIEQLLMLDMSVQAVATHMGLSWHTVKDIDKRRLIRDVGTPNYDGLRLLAIDEIAVHKGHRYMTVVLDLETGRVVWVGKDRSKETIASFFSCLSEEQKASIEAIAVDMSSAFRAGIEENCPTAVIVYDLFHIVQNYGRDVIDRVRIDEAKRKSAEGHDLVVGSKYLLLSNKENLPWEHRRTLSLLLFVNATLCMVYIMKEMLKEIWRYTSEYHAAWALENWCSLAEVSGIPALARFGKKLRKRADGIISHCRYPISTSRLEGINNRIKVIKRIAYGFRDDEYFALKIKAAFPGQNLQLNQR